MFQERRTVVNGAAGVITVQRFQKAQVYVISYPGAACQSIHLQLVVIVDRSFFLK